MNPHSPFEDRLGAHLRESIANSPDIAISEVIAISASRQRRVRRHKALAMCLITILTTGALVSIYGSREHQGHAQFTNRVSGCDLSSSALIPSSNGSNSNSDANDQSSTPIFASIRDRLDQFPNASTAIIVDTADDVPADSDPRAIVVIRCLPSPDLRDVASRLNSAREIMAGSDGGRVLASDYPQVTVEVDATRGVVVVSGPRVDAEDLVRRSQVSGDGVELDSP
jgi:hypothetical protein